jgi:hypothetical protein
MKHQARPEKPIACGHKILFIPLSLRFKCINSEENIWSVRITRGYRAIGILEGDTVTWFRIGSHDYYERFFS